MLIIYVVICESVSSKNKSIVTNCRLEIEDTNRRLRLETIFYDAYLTLHQQEIFIQYTQMRSHPTNSFKGCLYLKLQVILLIYNYS